MKEESDDMAIQALKNTPSKKKNKIRVWLFLFVSLPAVLLIVVLMLVSLVTGKQMSYPLPPLTAEAMSTQMKVFQHVYPEVSKKFPSEQAEIELTPSEVGNLLIIGRNAHALSHGVSPSGVFPDAYQIKYQDGKFRFNYSYRYGSMNFNFYAEVIPDFHSNRIVVKPIAFKVGSLRLPRSILTSSAESAIKKLQNNKDYKRFFEVIVSVEIKENHNLKVIYRPARLAELLWGFK